MNQTTTFRLQIPVAYCKTCRTSEDQPAAIWVATEVDKHHKNHDLFLRPSVQEAADHASGMVTNIVKTLEKDFVMSPMALFSLMMSANALLAAAKVLGKQNVKTIQGT